MDLWRRKDLVREDFIADAPVYAELPDQLGHTWCSAYVYLNENTFLRKKYISKISNATC